MLVFTVINIMGVRWLAETNSIAVYWKMLIPTHHDLRAGVHRLPLEQLHRGRRVHARTASTACSPRCRSAIVFAAEGFEQAIQVGGEAENPQRNIPRAVIYSMIIGIVIYILLEVAFIGALNPADLVHGWANPIRGVRCVRAVRQARDDGGPRLAVHPADHRRGRLARRHRPHLYRNVVAAVLRPGPQRLLPRRYQQDQQARRAAGLDRHLLRDRHARPSCRSPAGPGWSGWSPRPP